MYVLVIIYSLFAGLNAHAATLREATYASCGLKHQQLLLAMAWTETRFDERRIGSLGEVGILQLRPKYHPVNDVTDLRESFVLANSYLIRLERACKHLGPAWYTCYNTGETRGQKISLDRAMKSHYHMAVQGSLSVLRSGPFVSSKSQICQPEDAG